MHSISIWWESIQYTLIGIGEILTSISSYELFYSQVPESMRSVCQGLNLLTTSIGFMITGGINSVFSFWIPNDLDHGHLEYVYWFVAVITLLNMGAFVQVSQSFEYSDVGFVVGDGDGDGDGEKQDNEETPSNVTNGITTLSKVPQTSLSPNWTKHPMRAKWRRHQNKERAKSTYY
jgi:hypothetical protein